MEQEVQEKIELEARRILEAESKNYREHLEKQFGQLKWAIGVVVMSAVAVFIFLFGKTSSDLNEYARAQVSERVIDYKVKLEVQKRLLGIIDSEVASDNTKNKVVALIERTADEVIGNQAEEKLNSAVESKVKQINSIKTEQLLERVPVGSIIPSIVGPEKFAPFLGGTSTAQKKWILADGRAVPDSEYSKLIASNVPDLRGMFLRGLNVGRNDGHEDPQGVNRTAGDYQSDQFGRHSHSTVQMIGDNAVDGVDSTTVRSGDHHNETRQTGVVGGLETRPRNVAVYYYVRIN